MSWRIFILCVAVGAGLGGGMVFTHLGPGLKAHPQASSPASRNLTRGTLIQQLASALKQYHHDHGSFPVQLSATAATICTTSGTNCASKHYVDLSFLTTAGDYVPGIPQDPLGGGRLWDSGFTVSLNSGGTLQITAPRAELGKTITVTSQL